MVSHHQGGMSIEICQFCKWINFMDLVGRLTQPGRYHSEGGALKHAVQWRPDNVVYASQMFNWVTGLGYCVRVDIGHALVVHPHPQAWRLRVQLNDYLIYDIRENKLSTLPPDDFRNTYTELP